MAAESDNGNAMLIFRSPKLTYDYRDDNAYKAVLTDNFSDSGWKIPAILDAMMESPDIYFDELCQIKMPSWKKGRVVLIGDAAHAAGFPTGMGTTLAMQGATILADELRRVDGDDNKAFSEYEKTLRPIVESVQPTIINGIDFLVPKTAEEINLRNQQLA